MKIHLLLTKEEIDTTKMDEEKVAVVFDVLLATSTIVTALQFGAKEVIATWNKNEALLEAENRSTNNYLLVGEFGGKTLAGFHPPNPLYLKDRVIDKTVILTTTNGTVAIKKCFQAKSLLVCSLLNIDAVAKELTEKYKNETIVIVCSGSSGQFNMEDFYGAGSLIWKLLKDSKTHVEMNDAALAASMFYSKRQGNGEEILIQSHVGKFLEQYGLINEVRFVAKESAFSIVPRLVDRAIVVTEQWEKSNRTY